MFELALDLREVAEHVERSIEEDYGLPVGGTSHRLHGCSGKILERLVPHLALGEVIGERGGVEFQVIGCKLFHRGRHATVERLTPVRSDLGQSNFPNRVVREVEAVADPLDQALPYELLDTGGGLELTKRRCTLEQGEIELATDDRSGGYDLARSRAQPFQPARD